MKQIKISAQLVNTNWYDSFLLISRYPLKKIAAVSGGGGDGGGGKLLLCVVVLVLVVVVMVVVIVVVIVVCVGGWMEIILCRCKGHTIFLTNKICEF